LVLAAQPQLPSRKSREDLAEDCCTACMYQHQRPLSCLLFF
jgi:hypothetical protein